MITEGNERSEFRPKMIDRIRGIRNCFRNYYSDLIRYSRFRLIRPTDKGSFYFYFEPNKKHPGIADRMKSIVSAYNIANANGLRFYLSWETPYRLFDYFEPRFDMEFAYDNLKLSLVNTRLFEERFSDTLIPLDPSKQYICYRYQGHNMPRVLPNTGRKWCDVFHEMFRPSAKLESAYKALAIPEHTYVSCHLRFVNALEKFENTFFDNHLKTEGERNALIARCKKGIQEIIDVNPGKDVYVFSDSKIFLNSLSEMPVKVLPSDNIGHVSEGTNENGILKSFLDLYVMSKGDAVYRFCTLELYSISHYALLAATIGDIPFYDQTI